MSVVTPIGWGITSGSVSSGVLAENAVLLGIERASMVIAIIPCARAW
jgi:hypothetical protein